MSRKNLGLTLMKIPDYTKRGQNVGMISASSEENFMKENFIII